MTIGQSVGCRGRGGSNGKSRASRPFISHDASVPQYFESESHGIDSENELDIVPFQAAANQRDNTETIQQSSEPAGQFDPKDLTGNPLKTDFVLHPTDGYWFDNHFVVRKVTKSFKKTCGPYTCWTKTPVEVRAKWWTAFRDEFSWDASVAVDVKAEWRQTVMRRCRDVMSKVGRNNNYKADWCAPSIRDELKRKRADPKFIAKSKKCSDAKLEGPNAGSTHCQGSISTPFLARKMEKELRRKPSLAEVFKRGHSTTDNDDPNGEVSKEEIFIDAKSNRVWNKFLQLKASSSQNGEHRISDDGNGEHETDAGDGEPVSTNERENDVLFKAIGGYDKKGRLYGLGSLGKKYYKNVSSSKQRTLPQQSPRSEREIELENQVAMLIAKREEQNKKHDTLQAQVNRISELMNGQSNATDAFGSVFPPPPPPPPPSSGCHVA